MLLCMPTKSNSTPDFLISCHKMSKASDPMKPKKEFSKSHAMRASCQRGPRANVLACQRAKIEPTSNLYMPTCQTACHYFNLASQRAKWRANFSTWCANVPKGVPIFQTFLLPNAMGNFYTLLLYKKFNTLLDTIVIHIICICIANKNCIIFYFYIS